MQIVSIGDNLHERSKLSFLEKLKNYFKMSSAKIFTQLVKYCHVEMMKGENERLCAISLELNFTSSRFQTQDLMIQNQKC